MNILRGLSGERARDRFWEWGVGNFAPKISSGSRAPTRSELIMSLKTAKALGLELTHNDAPRCGRLRLSAWPTP